MTEFKIRRGLSSQLFPYPEYPNKLHEDLVIEPGCWYLCTDTADLFLGIQHDNRLSLKRINGDVTTILPENALVGISKAEINEAGELLLYYTDGSSANLGKVVGKDGDPGAPGDPGKDGLTTAVKIGDLVYTQKDGVVELPEFVNKDYVDNKFDSIEIPKAPENLSDLKNDVGYITQEDIPNVDLTDYALKEELPVVDGLASEEFVIKKIAEAELADQDVDLSAYYTKSEVNALIPEVPTKVSELQNDAGYSTKSVFVHDVRTLSADAYFTNDFTDYLDCKTDKVLVIKCGNSVYDAVEIQSQFPDTHILSFFRSSDELVKITLTINEDSGTANTFKWRCEPHIVSKLATEQFVKDSIDAINIPEADLSNYYNKTEVKAEIASGLGQKADKVLYTSSKIVTKPIGNFEIGDDLKYLTLEVLFAKLLGLTDSTGEEPDTPETPDAPTGIIEKIIKNELSMYTVTTDGSLSAIPYKLLTFTEETAVAAANESGFYQIKDASGNILESGYQELQVNNDTVYYTIALPKELDYNTMVTIKVYNTKSNAWEPIGEKFAMTSDPDTVASLCDEAGIDISHIDTNIYTVWSVDECPTGSILRFIIKE